MPIEQAHVKEPSPALDFYAKWRPRLQRGATWAGTAAFLSKTMGGEARHIIPATIAAGAAGAADATLEERLRRNHHPEAKKIVQHVFNEKKADGAVDPRPMTPEVVERAEEDTNGLLGVLFAHKDEAGARAHKQLGSLFDGAKDESYGRVARLHPGSGSLSALFRNITSRAR